MGGVPGPIRCGSVVAVRSGDVATMRKQDTARGSMELPLACPVTGWTGFISVTDLIYGFIAAEVVVVGVARVYVVCCLVGFFRALGVCWVKQAIGIRRDYSGTRGSKSPKEVVQ